MPAPWGALEGLASAGLWGVGDFAGGMGVKSSDGSLRAALRVLLVSHSLSLAVLLGVLAVLHDPLPERLPFAWGIVAGICGGLSLCAFYLALAGGAMGAAAAVSGLLAAAVPTLVAAVVDGSPGWQHLAGFALAAIAIWLIAAEPDGQTPRRTMWMAGLAGVGFGLYFIALKFAGPAGVLWPMTAARMGSLTTCTLLSAGLMRTGQPSLAVSRRMLGWAACGALFDTGGNLCFVAATRAGRLDIAAVLASLYPASTILLASMVLHERLPARRRIGLAVGTLAVLLVVL